MILSGVEINPSARNSAKFFNFFVDVAYVNSTYRGLSFGSEKTDELILSAGLGFNLQTRKKK